MLIWKTWNWSIRVLNPTSYGRSERSPQPREWPSLVVYLALATFCGSWASAGVDQWSGSGPGTAEVTRVIADPAGSGTVFSEFQNNFIRMSTDGGTTWVRTGLPLDNWNLGSVVFGAGGRDAMLAVLNQRPIAVPVLPRIIPPRVYRTDDRGATWYEIELALAGVAPSRAYFGLLYGATQECFYVSVDGGRSWAPRGSFPQEYWRSYPGFELTVSVSESETIWVAGNPGILKSTDGGWTWTAGGLNEQYLSLFVLCGPTGNVALAGDETRLWRSTDSGGSWVDVGLGVHQIVADPNNSSTLYAADATHLYRTSDAGAHWEPMWSADTDYIRDLAVVGGGSPTIYLATRDRGLLTTADGAAWAPVDLDVYAWADCLLADPMDDFALYAGAGRFFRTTDAGGAWAGPSDDAPVLGAVDLALGSAPKTFYAIAGQMKNKVYRSTDRGANWTKTLETAAYSLLQVDVAPSEPDVVYVAEHRGVYRSTNAGNSWTYSNQGLPSAGVSGLSIDPYDSQSVLLATSSGLFRSSNGGVSWDAVADFSGVRVDSVAFHARTLGVVLASAARTLYISGDGGLSWSALWVLGEPVGRICFDPLSDQTIYAASSSYLYRGKLAEGAWARFAPPEGQITDLVLTATVPSTLHVATNWGVYSLALVSGDQSDFEVTQTVSRRGRDGVNTFTLYVTNRGPADFGGTVRVEDVLPANVFFVSARCPGWRMEEMGYYGLVFAREGLFPAGQTSEIVVKARATEQATSASSNRVTVTPSLPVDNFFWNNTALPERLERRARPSPVGSRANRAVNGDGTPSR